MKETESLDIDRKEMTRFQQHWEKLPELTRAAIDLVVAKGPMSRQGQAKGASAETADKQSALGAYTLIKSEKIAKAVALTNDTWRRLDEREKYEFEAVTGKEASNEVFFGAVAEKMLHGMPLEGRELSDEQLVGLLWTNVMAVKEEVKRTRPVSAMDIGEKVRYFREHSPVFADIHRVIDIFCLFVRPLWPEVDSFKYWSYFFSKLDFELTASIERAQSLAHEQVAQWELIVFYGLEHVFRGDIEQGISKFKANIPQLSPQEAIPKYQELVRVSGDIERHGYWNDFQNKSFSTLHYEFMQKEHAGFAAVQTLVVGFGKEVRESLAKEYKQIVESFKERDDIQREIAKHQKDVQKELKDKAQAGELRLADLFESIEHCNYIMGLLVKNGYCEPVTHLWKDTGNGHKNVVVALLKKMHLLGYYKNRKPPTSKQIKTIAQNTFSVPISIDTINKATADDLPKLAFGFLPVKEARDAKAYKQDIG